jgi:ubiquinone/menaquinone biosynthesis C-methylase UbiE
VNNPFRVLEQRWEIRRLKRLQPLAPGFVALEVGCGRGVGAGLILKEFRPAWIHALDVDIGMVRKAKGHLSAHGEMTSVLVGDAACLPVKTGSVDAVFGFGVLHHIADWRAALAEIARVLKRRGIYFFEELYPAVYQNRITRNILLHPTENRFSGRDLRQALDEAGLPLKQAIELKKLAILGCAVKDISGGAHSFSTGKVSPAPSHPMTITRGIKESIRIR